MVDFPTPAEEKPAGVPSPPSLFCQGYNIGLPAVQYFNIYKILEILIISNNLNRMLYAF